MPREAWHPFSTRTAVLRRAVFTPCGCVRRLWAKHGSAGEVTPAGLQRGEGRHAGGFGTQDARAEGDRLPAGSGCLRDFRVGQAGFGADEQRDTLLSRDRGEAAGRRRRKHQLQAVAFGPLGQGFGKGQGRRDCRAYEPTALFGGGFGHRLPMRLFFFQPAAFELDLAAFGEHRLDAGHAQFDGLGQGEVHAVATGDGLVERDRQRRFALRAVLRGNGQRHALAIGMVDMRGVLVAVAVEQRDRRLGAKPEHRAQMMPFRVIERDDVAHAKGCVEIDARNVAALAHAYRLTPDA